ncbi:hypothetical protein ACFY2V_40335 [Streptomyces eurythermus]|uniref:hypothetical protein n=1 Tax=Streptomyces eurythermus TaxID=42237 RepID=UPI003674512C
MSTPLVNAQEWPSGLTVTWSSLSGLWTYVLVDEYGLENTELLPAPALAAPSAVIAVLPALMDGRRGLLPRSQERWEHAELLESWAQSAAVLGDDKYDAAFQAAEEEAASFLRWQDELDAAGVTAGQQGAGRSQESGEPAGPTRYRVVAQRAGAEHGGAATLTHYAYARSVEEAVAQVRQEHEKPGGVYGDQGLYRVVEVCEDGPQGRERQEEDARRRFVSAVMKAAHAEAAQELTHLPHSEMFGILCDFFTRAIVFPGQFGFPSGTAPEDTQLHTSSPARALSRLLLEHLTHHALELVEADDRAPLSVVGVEAEGWFRAARDDEDTEAPAELIEQVLAVCDQHYAAVTGTNSQQWERESSREVVGIALRTVRLADREAYPRALEEYLVEHRARLEKLWRIYGPLGVFPLGVYHLVESPASFMLCERIDNAPMWLKGVWGREIESDTPLERLEEAWLYGTSEGDGR